MKTLFAMRRANGDWFALDDEGRYRVPVFESNGAAMIARSRDLGMLCFRPVPLDQEALDNLLTTEQGQACFWLVADPLRSLSYGKKLDQQQLETFIQNGNSTIPSPKG